MREAAKEHNQGKTHYDLILLSVFPDILEDLDKDKRYYNERGERCEH